MKLFHFVLAGVGLVLPLNGVTAAGLHGINHHARHADIARRAEGDVQLWKRVDHSRWSFYDVGLGACGKHNVASDFIVALNTPQYGGGYPGPHCFKTIVMQYNGKTTEATIMDQCPGCGYGGLDLSRGLFRFFDSEDKGLIYGSWWFKGEGPAAPPSRPTTRRPTTTRRLPTPTYRPPTTTVRLAPTTTKSPEPSTTSTRGSTSTRSEEDRTSSSASPTGSSGYAVNTGLAAPVASGIIEQGNVYNLNEFNRALVGMGELVLAGAEAE